MSWIRRDRRGRRGRRGRRAVSLGRPAVTGEVCTCGAPALVVFDDVRLGLPFGSCLALDSEPHGRVGACAFCGVTGPHVSAGVCPAYILRPAWASAPAVHALTGVWSDAA